MGEFSELVKRAASGQGGIFSGDNPAYYNSADPIRLWVIQVLIIMAMTQFLSMIFSRMRQPRVIAEIIGGVLLGPTVMGRIPGFRAAIFPNEAMPLLNLTSTIGLVLFLFIVGLEIDVRVIKNNYRASAAISLAGLVIPLGLGAALGVAIYNEFTDPEVNYGYFLLFTAVAVGITAFPVLCRILTELKLLDTPVGAVTLAAGVGNDVVGWVLLALTVALVNASSGLTALWVLLTAVGYVLLLLYPGRWGYVWLAKRTGSLEQGAPSTVMMTLTMVIVFFSAFFTDIIGVHPIFGGFLAGLIIPHKNGYAIALTEKIEDLVTILFLPLYFALSGLRTNLGYLDNGVTWGYTILICVVAFSAKFFACAATAKVSGFNWRESGAIGSLMSCKGLVELIVLNVGLQANILSTRTFSMFVVHAIILTFITTPLVLLFYPERARIHNTTKPIEDAYPRLPSTSGSEEEEMTNKFALVLDKIEQLPAAMTVTQLLCPTVPCVPSRRPISISSLSDQKASEGGDILSPLPPTTTSPTATATSAISLTLLRLIELTTRTSGVLKSQEASALIHADPVVSVFKTFAWLLGGAAQRLRVKVGVDVVWWEEFGGVVGRRVREEGAGMVVLPWASGNGNGNGVTASSESTGGGEGLRNPFDGVFNKTSGSPTSEHMESAVVYSEFIRKVFLTAPCDVALFVDRGLPGPSSTSVGSGSGSGPGPDTVLVLPFFGGPDDRLALKFLVRMCEGNEGVKGVVVRVLKSDGDDDDSVKSLEMKHNTIAGADTIYGQQNTETRLASETADSLLWAKYTSPPSSSSSPRTPSLESALSRIEFSTIHSTKPLQSTIDLFTSTSSPSRLLTSTSNVVAVVGRSRRLAPEAFSLGTELKELVSGRGAGGNGNGNGNGGSGLSMSSSVVKTLGNVGAGIVVCGVDASLLVVQACVGLGGGGGAGV